MNYQTLWYELKNRLLNLLEKDTEQVEFTVSTLTIMAKLEVEANKEKDLDNSP
jgi:hypothetical protein